MLIFCRNIDGIYIGCYMYSGVAISKRCAVCKQGTVNVVRGHVATFQLESIEVSKQIIIKHNKDDGCSVFGVHCNILLSLRHGLGAKFSVANNSDCNCSGAVGVCHCDSASTKIRIQIKFQSARHSVFAIDQYLHEFVSYVPT